MTSVSSSFHFDDALAKDHRSAYTSAPADQYPSPPMSPPQPLPAPAEPYPNDATGYDASFYAEIDAVERDRQLAQAEQQREAQASSRARPVSYQPTTTGSSMPYATTLSPEEQLYQYEHASREQHEWHAQQAAAAAAGSHSRKRASHQPPSATERAAPRERTIGEDHPAVVAFKKEHPRRAQLEFGSYILLQTLGEGEFGKVKLSVHKDFGEECAVKLIKKHNLGGDGDSRMLKVRREIEVLSHVKHPNVVRLYDLVETEKYIGIILGFADGGELFDHILAHRYLKEKDAAKLFAQLISGVHYLHSKNIIHRDLKLENLLLDKARNVIITDFGFANQFDASRNDLMATSCGSPCYAAPELVVAEGLYAGSAVDIWSCGVILYAMLSGYLPFDDDPANPEGDNINLLYRYILNTQLQFPAQISPVARDLLSIMLVPDPARRATMRDIMAHPWLEKHANLLNRSVDELEEVANRQHRLKRQQARKEMEERKALKEQAAQRQAAKEMARSQSSRAGLLATVASTTTRVKAQRHQSALPTTSTTMPDFFAQGVRETASTSPSTPMQRSPSSRSRTGDEPPSDVGGHENDLFLTEGDARGEPRSRVGSLASGFQLDQSGVDVTTAPTSTSRRKHHTIQVEYASEPDPELKPLPSPSQPMDVIDSSHSPPSSSRSRTTTQLSATLPISGAVLPAPVVTAYHSVASPASASPAPVSPPLAIPDVPLAMASREVSPAEAPQDVEMALSVSPPQLLSSAASSVADTALPTPAPSQLMPRPTTPPNTKGPAPADLLTTPKASLGQALSPPDTPRGPALADITNASAAPVAVLDETISPPVPAQREVAPSPAAKKPLPTVEAVTAAPLEATRSRSTRSRMSALLDSTRSNLSSSSPASEEATNRSNENAPIDTAKAKADKKGRRNTLTLAFKSTLDRRSSKKATPTSSVFTEPTTTRFSKSSSRPSSRMSTGPLAQSPRTPVDGQFQTQQRQPPVGRTTAVSSVPASSTASTGPAQKVMDWFRKKSLKTSTGTADHRSPGKTESFVNIPSPSTWTPPPPSRLSTDLSHAVVPASPSPPAISTETSFAPALVVTGTTDFGANPPPSATLSTRSTAPSSYRAAGDSLSSQRTTASTRQQADALAMPPPTSTRPVRAFNPANIRYHAGVIDQKTVTSRLPPAVLDQILRALQALDVEVKRDGEFRLKCTRSKRARNSVGLGIASAGIPSSGSTGGFSFMGMASSPQTDKRGLPMPTSSSASFLSSSGLKGLMMRRSSSYSSSVHLSPIVAPPQSPSLDDSASSVGHTSEEAAPPAATGVHAAPQQDAGDEVRFSVEITRLKNLPGLYSVDFKRIKGSVWSYKSIYQKAVDSCAFEDVAK